MATAILLTGPSEFRLMTMVVLVVTPLLPGLPRQATADGPLLTTRLPASSQAVPRPLSRMLAVAHGVRALPLIPPMLTFPTLSYRLLLPLVAVTSCMLAMLATPRLAIPTGLLEFPGCLNAVLGMLA